MSGRILIIDDHPVVLYGLRFLFQENRRFTIGGEASDAGAAREAAERLQPDYAILDLVLGGRDGMELLQDVLDVSPDTKILIYSSQDEWRFARRCIHAGARGFVAKSEGLTVVADALAVIARGETYLGEALRRRLAEALVFGVGPNPATVLDDLSNRELQVLHLLAEGRTTREISDTLSLSMKTIGTYCDRLKTKLFLASQRDLEAFARDQLSQRAGT